MKYLYEFLQMCFSSSVLELYISNHLNVAPPLPSIISLPCIYLEHLQISDNPMSEERAFFLGKTENKTGSVRHSPSVM